MLNIKKISFIYLSLLVFPAFFWIKQDAHAITSFVNESKWNQAKNLFALTKRNFRTKRNIRTKRNLRTRRNYSQTEVIKQWDFEEDLFADFTDDSRRGTDCFPSGSTKHYPKDFYGKSNGQRVLWNYRKGSGGDSWITQQGYRSNNALAISHQNNKSSCHLNQKMEYHLTNVLNKFPPNPQGSGIFSFGLVRYTGFALKLGETLNPQDSTYFESPQVNSYVIAAQWRQDSSATESSPILSATIVPVKGKKDEVALALVSRRGKSTSLSSSIGTSPFYVKLKKAQWYNIVVATRFNAPSTGQMGFVEFYVNGKPIKVSPGQDDTDPSTLYRWEQNIGYSDLRNSNNDNSSFLIDIYRPNQPTRQTIFFDKIRISTSANNEASDNARLLADPSKW
jgi:hypothetical protein